MTQVGQNITADNASWNFNEIADDFDDHVAKSIPLYEAGQDLVCQFSDFFVQPDSTVTELGTSTGALAAKFLAHHSSRHDLRYLGIDVVPSMLTKAKQRCQNDTRAEFLEEDIATYQFESSSLFISYYTVQFLHPRIRQEVINRIYQALDWGGAFILFEKVRGPDARFQDIASQIYTEYKLQQSFSEAEIVNKSRSLKGVLEPFSTQGNLDLLSRAGFTDVCSIMKWVSFEGFLAIK